MEILFFLIPIAMGLSIFGIFAFYRATSDGQFDDLQTPSQKILNDDDIKND